MISVIESNREALSALCQRFGVARLDVFGSAAEGTFKPDRSDVDFLVEFVPDTDLGPWMSRYFELRDALSELLGCNVDLVMAGGLRNPYFISEVNRTRKVVYEG